ncbi:unnamed protein product [Paramecium primaurelia]|uniref:Uncharacterized protein n=1 Tax=Paramecium primaurelia TaxID=5886 RepID=A0A8S1NQ48_PARPR|nr:unnamed protein product [Paramecium primaurelia]
MTLIKGKYIKILQSIGNYTQNKILYFEILTQEQAIQNIEISLRYCPSQCSICSEQFNCIRRNTNYYISKWNLCVLCTGNIQFKINVTNNLDLILLMHQNLLQFQLVVDSRLLIKEFISLEIIPVMYSENRVVSQTGQNLPK